MDKLLHVNGLWKKYSRDLNASVRYATRELLHNATGVNQSGNQLRDTEFWALRDINFSLRRGEVLGILGHNGAGKSTLLKCIAGKLHNERGQVIRNGELGHLLEMSAGFAPMLTGRDNITIRGQLLGKRGKDLQHYISEVEEFAGVEEFFDAPVQFYSSGMKSRLGFAASSVIEPDILIIDEVLAVGDLAFRLRCYERINELARKSAVIFVSHSIGQVSRLCTRGMYLEKGKMLYEGDVQQTISMYQDNIGIGSAGKKYTTLNPELTTLRFLVEGQICEGESDVDYGSNIKVDVDVSSLPKDAQIRIILKDISQNLLMDWNSKRGNIAWPESARFIRVDLGQAELASGIYLLSAQIMTPNGAEHLCISEPVVFRVKGDMLYPNAVQKQANWEFIGK